MRRGEPNERIRSTTTKDFQPRRHCNQRKETTRTVRGARWLHRLSRLYIADETRGEQKESDDQPALGGRSSAKSSGIGPGRGSKRWGLQSVGGPSAGCNGTRPDGEKRRLSERVDGTTNKRTSQTNQEDRKGATCSPLAPYSSAVRRRSTDQGNSLEKEKIMKRIGRKKRGVKGPEGRWCYEFGCRRYGGKKTVPVWKREK